MDEDQEEKRAKLGKFILVKKKTNKKEFISEYLNMGFLYDKGRINGYFSKLSFKLDCKRSISLDLYIKVVDRKNT